MRRLIPIALTAALLSTGGCRRERVPVEATEEGQLTLTSSLAMGDPKSSAQIVKGLHQIEGSSWRWSMGQFAVTLRPPANSGQKGATLSLQYSVPETVIQKLGPSTLSAKLNGRVLAAIISSKPGAAELVAEVPASELRGETVTFDFSLDKFFQAGEVDTRELGVIVTSVGLMSR